MYGCCMTATSPSSARSASNQSCTSVSTEVKRICTLYLILPTRCNQLDLNLANIIQRPHTGLSDDHCMFQFTQNLAHFG